MNVKRTLLLFFVLSLFLLGCGFNFAVGATATPTALPPTATTAPTEAPPATDTPVPTNTKAPVVNINPTATTAATAAPATPEPVETKAVVARGQGGAVKKPGGAEAAGTGGTVFEFRSHTAWADDYGGISIVGEVVNVSDRTIDTLVTVETILMDANGETVPGEFGAYLDRPVIAPGEKSSFWVVITSDQLGSVSASSITDYELVLWITETPSPDIELTVDSADAAEDMGAFYIDGYVTNQTEYEFTSLSVYSTLYNAAGDVINATVDVIDLDVPLGPGEQAAFEGYFVDHFEDADSFYVVVTGWTAEYTGGGRESDSGGLRAGEGELEVTSHTGWIDDQGNIHIVGEAENVSGATIDTMVLIEASLTDAGGNEVEGDFSAYLDRPAIEPGDKSSFWVLITSDELGGADASQITDYELFMWISDELSPDVELTVAESESYEDGGYFYISGIVGNQTDLTYSTLAVYSTLYDAAGNVINVTVDMIEADPPLGPGEKTEFQGYFIDRFEDADSYYVVVTGYPD